MFCLVSHTNLLATEVTEYTVKTRIFRNKTKRFLVKNIKHQI
jgi:hypothetical protein